MIQLQRILFPTDFSQHAARAQDYACEFADKFAAQLHLMHVLETHVSAAPEFAMGLALPQRIEESEQDAQRALAGLLEDKWQADHDVVLATAHGTPFVEIIRYAKSNQIDLIVMATHGRSAWEHVLMGSVAERVVRKAPCPVLTIRPEGHQFVMP